MSHESAEMRAFVNIFKALGQTSLSDWLLHSYVIIRPALVDQCFLPPPPCPSLFPIRAPRFLSGRSPLPSPSRPSAHPSFLSLSKLYIWLLSPGRLPSLLYLFFIIVFRASVTCFRWMFQMAWVSFIVQVFFLEFCSVFKYKCKLDLSNVEF